MITAERMLYVFGTIVQLKVYGENAERAVDEAVDRLSEIDDKLSVFKEYSEISDINMRAGIKAQRVSQDTYFLLKKSVEYSKILEGAFDPTIRPLVDLWGIGTNKEGIPEKEDIEEKIKLVNYNDMIFSDKETSVMLKQKQQHIDLGGIAKGYAADEVRNIFMRNKIESAIIDLGGNIFVLGSKPNGQPWNVGIQDPLRARGEFIGIINAENKSIVTSGNYEKYFIKDGKKFHHIIDPRTGYPSESDIISVTVFSDNSIDGDGLSTGLYIIGIDKAMKLIESMKGIEAIFITEDKKIYMTSGINNNFKLVSQKYRM